MKMTDQITSHPLDTPSTDILIGNSFPLSLIRRSVSIDPFPTDELRLHLENARLHSFWGHENTLHAASQWLGVDLAPKTERPVVVLSDDGLPQLDSLIFNECFILSPDYRLGFRPVIGAEVASEDIISWTVLKITWK